MIARLRFAATAIVALFMLFSPSTAFSTSAPSTAFARVTARHPTTTCHMSEKGTGNDNGVVELLDEPTDKKESAAAPFLSQGEISEEALNVDMSDPKQARVMTYIILSLIPVLFLIPLMLGSRELIPIDSLPPVQM